MRVDERSDHNTGAMSDVSPPLRQSSDPQSDARRVESLLRWMLRVLIGCGFAVFTAASLFQTQSLLWYSLLIFAYVGLLIWARRQLGRGRTSQAILSVSAGMLLCSVVSVVLVPDTAPASTLVPLMAVGLALPYLNTRMLRFFIFMTWLVTGLVVVLSETAQLFPSMPYPFATILHLEVIVVTPLISWLLWQHHIRLIQLLNEAQSNNQILHQAHQALEVHVRERKHAEEQLIRLALYDSLTDLPNRTLFRDRLDQALLRGQRDPAYQFAILFLDLDRFKNINDSLGHRVGDELLISIARRLQHCLRVTDTVSRLGGDEFAVLLSMLTDVRDAILVAERIQHDLAAPFIIQGHAIFTTASIGVALNTTLSYAHPDEILRDADTAMYQAKAGGRAGYMLFDPAMHVSAVARLRLEHDLRYALEREEFVLYYQPQVELSSGQVIGVEALMRWQHPERGLISPVEFIPIAEETGLIVPIGEWGLRTACRQGKIWHTAGATGLKVAVNLSAGQFKHHSLPNVVADILTETGFDPQCLELELTESDTMEHADASVSTLRTLKSLGIGIAIDDFGTGYSSLSYLQRLPIDVVKIDRSFVQHSNTDVEDWTIAQTIIAMAHSLRLQVIAEGVETEEQRAFLTHQGCQMAQGYLFSRPLPAEQVMRLLYTDQQAVAARV
jgi:diguanylate cyclase (GGDEF)-like protein